VSSSVACSLLRLKAITSIVLTDSNAILDCVLSLPAAEASSSYYLALCAGSSSYLYFPEFQTIIFLLTAGIKHFKECRNILYFGWSRANNIRLSTRWLWFALRSKSQIVKDQNCWWNTTYICPNRCDCMLRAWEEYCIPLMLRARQPWTVHRWMWESYSAPIKKVTRSWSARLKVRTFILKFSENVREKSPSHEIDIALSCRISY